MDIEKITDVMRRVMQDSIEREMLSALTDGYSSSSDGNHTISADELYQNILDVKDRLDRYDIARTLKVHANPYLTDKVRTFTPRSKRRRIQKKCRKLYSVHVIEPDRNVYIVNREAIIAHPSVIDDIIKAAKMSHAQGSYQSCPMPHDLIKPSHIW